MTVEVNWRTMLLGEQFLFRIEESVREWPISAAGEQ